MTDRMPHRDLTSLLAGAALAAGAFLGGCSEPPPPPPPPVAKAPPPPPAPVRTVTPIKELMAQYNIDPRVNLPEERAPDNDPARIAVLKFFDAFVRGNTDGLRAMLSAPDQFQLDGLVTSGAFAKTTEGVTRIDVRCGRGPDSECTLAVFHVGEQFQPQLWAYTINDNGGEFDSVATPPGIMDKLSGDNWIAAWFDVLKMELAKAGEPDEVIEIPQQDFTTDDGTAPPVDTGGTGPGPAAPGGPGKRTPGAPIDAPRAPGFGTR